ncbi:MAG: DsbA family protein [bacterium]|nr:DsbA family protein [bacterium]
MTGESKVIIGVVVTTVIVLIAGVMVMSSSQPPVPSAKVETSTTLHGDAYSKGPKDAKVKIAEYADFQCPACAVSFPIMKEIISDYGDKIYFEYHHYPLKQHAWSQVSAEAAEAAGAQGKFWEYHDMLYAKQNDWAESKDAKSIFSKYAAELKIDQKKFDEDLKNNTHRQKVLNSFNRGNTLSVQATPTYFVNGVRYEGGLNKEDWKKIIDPLLK